MATQVGQLKYSVGFDIKKADLNSLKKQLQQLQKLSFSDFMKINNTDLNTAKEILNNVRKEAQHVEGALTKAFNAKLNTYNVQIFNKAIKSTSGSMQNVYNTFKQAGTVGQNAFRSLTTQVLNTNLQLKQTHSFLEKIGTTLGNSIKWGLSSAVINGLSRTVQQAYGYVKSLDTSLNDIRIVTGKSADEMANFAIQANNAAQALGKTTVDYTKASLIYAQQGLNDQEIAARAAITLKAANVTGQSTDEVSEQLTSVWNGYKVTAEQAQLYIDRLAAVAAKTASNLEQLSTGMSKVAAAAAAMGVGQDQLAAQLSTIISVTRQAPESVGTALRTVYARISDIKAGIDEDGVTLGNYSGKMAQLGFNVLDVSGKLRDMGEVMEEIGGKWEYLTREQQVSLAQTMAGQRQYSNLIALFDNFNEYNRALNIAQNSAGTLQKQQDTYMQSTRAHLNQLKAATENLYDSLLNPDNLKPLINGLTSVVNWAAEFVDSIGGGINVFKMLGAVGITVLSKQIGQGISTTINNLRIAHDNTNQLRQSLQALKEWRGIPGLDQMSKSILDSENSLAKLSRFMSQDQFNEMQGLVNKITETGNALQTIKNKKNIFVNTLSQVSGLKKEWKSWNEVMEMSQGYQDLIQDRLSKLSTAYTNISTELKKGNTSLIQSYVSISNGSKIFNDVSNSVNSTKSQLDGYIKQIHNLANDNSSGLSAHKEQINQLVQEYNQLGNISDQEGIEKLSSIINKLQGFAQGAKNSIDGISQQLVQNFKQALVELGASEQEAEKLIAKLKASWDSNMKNLKVTQVTTAITSIIGSLSQVYASISQIQSLANNVWKDSELSTGQKILKSLPVLFTTLTSSIYVANTAMKVFGITSAGAMAAATAGISLVITGVSALIGWLLSASDAEKEFREEIKKTAEANIEQQNKIQEQITANKQLYQSVEELNKKYQQGQITRFELRSQIEDLVDQYGLESSAVQDLIKDYNNLNEVIKQKRIEDAQQGIRSASRELNSAKVLIGQNLNKYNNIVFDIGSSDISDEKKFLSYFEQAGFRRSGGARADLIGASYDSWESFISLYDKIGQALQKIEDDINISTKQKVDAESYRKITEWYKNNTDAAEKYKQALKDVQKYQNELNILTNQQINVNNITTATQYLKQRQQVIKTLQANGVQQAQTAADAYLRENHRKVFIQFDELSKYITQIQGKISDGTEEDTQKIEEMLNVMDEQHIAYFMDTIDLRNIDNWAKLEKYIEKISDIDLSNIHYLTDMQGISSAKEAASENYTFLQSLEDQIKSGKSIGAKELKNLTERFPQLQKYFTMMANGQYKMTEDAKTFYDAIDSLKISKFYDVITDINNAIERNQKIVNGNIDLESLSIQYYSQNVIKKGTSNKKQGGKQLFGEDAEINEYQRQLQFQSDKINEQIEVLKQLRSYDQKFINDLQQKQQLFNSNIISDSQRKQLADYFQNAIQEQLKVDLDTTYLEAQEKQVKLQMHEALFPTDEDIESSALAGMTKLVQGLAQQSDQLANILSRDARAAEDVAESILRFNNAIEDVVKNYDTWLDVLDDENKSLQQVAQILQPLRDAYADLLGGTGKSLSGEFLQSADNLKLMKQAIDGNLQSYEQLRTKAADDIIAHIYFDSAETANNFISEHERLRGQIEEFFKDPVNIKVGAQISDELKGQLADLVNSAKMTADQAQEYLLDAFGIDAKVINQEKTETVDEIWQGAEAQVDTEEITGATPLGSKPTTYVIPSIHYNPVPQKIQHKKTIAGTALQVIGAKKSAGGKIKWQNSSQGAGAAGTARRTAAASKTKSSKKDITPAKKDSRDIYHDINIQLAEVNRQLNSTQKQQSKLYGKDLINNLNKQTQILEQHKNKLKEKNALQKLDLEQKQKQLAALGVLFDQYGHIVNYLDILGVKQGNINGLIAQRNSLVEQYNNQVNENTRKTLDDQISALDKQIKTVETDYKDLETAIKNYDTLRTQMEDLVDQIQEETEKQVEIRINKAQMKVQISLDMGDFEREWNEYERKVRNRDDLFNDSDFDTLFKNAGKDFQDIWSYFDVFGESSLVRLTNGINDILAEDSIQEILNWDNVSKLDQSVYSDHVKQALDDLKSYSSQIIDQIGTIQDLKNSIDQAYFDTIDYINSEFDRQIEQYEFVNQRLQHDIDLVQLVYGEKAYDSMDAYYTQLLANDNKELDSLKQQAAYYKQMWDNAIGEQDARKFEELWRETMSQLDSKLAESIQTAQDQYINAINKIYDQLDKRLTHSKGLEYVQMEWQLINKNVDEYLDTINSAFALRDLESKFQKAINDTKNVKNQKTLTDLMNQQLDHLRTKDKLTQYDVERAEKLLGIEQARMALEDTRNAKTSLRLKRDSQGNYSYVYTASEKDIDDAEDKLAKLQNDLYNFDKQAYRDNLDDMLSAYKEYLSKQQDILIKYKDDEEARERALTLLRQQYGEYINGKTQENIQIRTNLANSATEDYIALYNENSLNFKQSLDTDYQNFEQLTQSMKEELASQFVPNWQNSVQQMTETFIGQGGFAPACKTAWQEVDAKTVEYQTTVHTLADSAGRDLDQLKTGIDKVKDAYSELITQNDALIKKMDQQMGKINTLRKQLDLLQDKYKDVWSAADLAAQKAYDAWMQWQKYTQDVLNTPTPNPTVDYNPPTTLLTIPTVSTTNSSFDNEDKSLIGGNLDKITNKNIITAHPDETVLTPYQDETLTQGLAGAIYHQLWGPISENSDSQSWRTIKQSIVNLARARNLDVSSSQAMAAIVQARRFLKQGSSPGRSLEYYEKYYSPQSWLPKLKKYDTGGYTGEWGPSGRLAMLHQKQLVLNATDTKNILNSVAIIRDMVTGLSGNIFSRLNSLNGGYSSSIASQIGGQVDQNVTISASFPNVNSKKEIEDAFTELVNLAAQRAMKR